MKKEKPNVRVSFTNLTRKKRDNLFKAEKYLRLAGVDFDTGFDLQGNRRDWELDYSLTGADIIIKSTKKSYKPFSDRFLWGMIAGALEVLLLVYLFL